MEGRAWLLLGTGENTMRLTIISIISFSWFSLVSAEEAAFEAPKTMLDTADRLLTKEKDPSKRLEILFRWIKIKEDYESTLQRQSINLPSPVNSNVKSFTQSKVEIVDRLLGELSHFEGLTLPLDRLHRELAFRLLEQKRFSEAKTQLEALSKRTTDDELAYGDALIGSKRSTEALAAYERASLDQRLKTVAAYKRAWAYLSLSDFSNSLREFDIALEENIHTPSKMREEAYKDRLRPYIETFAKPDFSEGDATLLRDLSLKIHPISKGDKNILYQEALKNLIQGFNAKNDIKKAQQIFSILIQEVPKDSEEANEVLISAAPTWLQIHRARLEHDDVARILDTLPAREFDITQATALHAELNNTAAFYETLVSDKQDERGLDPKARTLLTTVYKKYFIFFSKDADADPLRINYARILLQDGDAESCLKILDQRFKREANVEKLALGLEAQCDLKYLDQLYAREHDNFFYSRLDSALVKNKSYKRPEIGIPEAQAFESLSQMLIGAIKKNTKSDILRGTLKDIIAEYPFAPNDKLNHELKILSAELRFEDLAVAEIEANEKAKLFFAIHQETPVDSSVGMKSLRNSILLTTEREGLDRCDEFQKSYLKDFTLNGDIHTRCLNLAEHHLQLEKEVGYWKLHEAKLDETQKIRLAILELGLGHEREGNTRLNALKTPRSKLIQDFWYGNSEPKKNPSPKIAILEKQATDFTKSLKKVQFTRMAKVVPIMISNYRAIDRELVKASKLDTDQPLSLAKVLSSRALIAGRMRDWMKGLPEPGGLNEEDLKRYREQTTALLKPWEDQAEQLIKECSETAYALSPEFENSTACPEATLPSLWNQMMEKWQSSRQYANSNDADRLYDILYDAGVSEKDSMRARYFLIRAYDLSNGNQQKAKIQLAMAKLLDRDRYWNAAAELDGNLTEPILRQKTRANGNPFYERLYDTQIELIMKGERFESSRPFPLSATFTLK